MTGPQEVDTAEIRARYPDVFDRPASARLAMPAMIVAALGIFIYGLVDLDFSPSRFIAGLSQLGWISMMMIPPDPGSSLPIYLKALGETLSIALLGTTLAALFALPVSLLAARNVVPSIILRFPVRRFLDSIRGVDTLIWALVWINVVGLGPFAGVLAIAVSDFGAFGKLFSEAIEGADQKQVEGIRASGGSALHEIRFGLLPQVLPVIAGQVLYFIESNTRSATIIGIVGAGGIGLQLAEQIRVLEWQKVSFLILMILVAVAAIDFVSSKLRFAIIGRRGCRLSSSPLPACGERPKRRSAAGEEDSRASPSAHRDCGCSPSPQPSPRKNGARERGSPLRLHQKLHPLRRETRVLRHQRLALEIEVRRIDHQDRPPQRQIEPRGVGRVDDAGGDPGRAAAIITDPVMLEHLRHRARRGKHRARARKQVRRQPGGGDADRRAVGEADGLDPHQRRAGLQSQFPRELAGCDIF